MLPPTAYRPELDLHHGPATNWTRTRPSSYIYELGVRHALRPHTTIIIAESQFEFPFDLSHIVIRPYEHLGKWIDAEHAEMFRGQLRDAIEALLKEPDIDSPVYRLLPRLRAWNAGVAPILDAAAEEVAPMLAAAEPHAAAAPHPAGETDESISELMAMFRADLVAALLGSPRDPPEAGAEYDHGDSSIQAHEKGFYVKNDYYNGINLAFMLNVRAAQASDPREALADMVQAERIRRRVIDITEKLLADGIKHDDRTDDLHEIFWVKATLAESLTGSGRKEDAARLREEITRTAPEAWMVDSMNEQLGKLEALLVKVAGNCEPVRTD